MEIEAASNKRLERTRHERASLLGYEENIDENESWHWLNEEYDWGINPVKVEHLVIKFNPSGDVEKITHEVRRK
jgi:hypothetical protein